MVNHFTHHDTSSSNYKYHVVNIGNTTFCLGCLASNIFSLIILPLLLSVFIIVPAPFFSITIDVAILLIITLPQVAMLIFEIWKGKRTYFKYTSITNTIYLVLAHFYIILSLIPNIISITILSVLITLLILPQVLIYIYKIITTNEFKHRFLKFTARILFITGYFFTLLFAHHNILYTVVITLLGGLFFYKLRAFANYQVDKEEKNLALVSAVNYHSDNLFTRFLRSTKIFDENGKVISTRSGEVDLKIIIIIGGVIVLFVLGFIIVGVSDCSPTCCDQTSNCGKCCGSIKCCGVNCYDCFEGGCGCSGGIFC